MEGFSFLVICSAIFGFEFCIVMFRVSVKILVIGGSSCKIFRDIIVLPACGRSAKTSE